MKVVFLTRALDDLDRSMGEPVRKRSRAFGWCGAAAVLVRQVQHMGR